MGGAEYPSNLTDEQWRIIENSCQSRNSEVASRLIGGVFSTRSCTGIGPGVSGGTCPRNFPIGTRYTACFASGNGTARGSRCMTVFVKWFANRPAKGQPQPWRSSTANPSVRRKEENSMASTGERK